MANVVKEAAFKVIHNAVQKRGDASDR